MREHDLLAAILANPDDEGLRLVYADFLFEHGDGAAVLRAELIQVQCRLARFGGAFRDWDHWANEAEVIAHLQEREKQLLDAHGAAWAAPLHTYVRDYTYRRGFVEDVTLTGTEFSHHAAKLFELIPLRRIRFVPDSTSLSTLFRERYLARLRALDLSGSAMSFHLCRTLFSMHSLFGIKELHLSRTHFDDARADLLASSPWFLQLEVLDLSHNNLGPAGAQRLLHACWPLRLRWLDLSGNAALGPGNWSAWATGPGALSPESLQPLLRLMTRSRPPFTNSLARTLTAGLAGTTAPEAVDLLSKATEASHVKMRAAAVQMLGRLGSHASAALPWLVRRLHDPGGGARAATIATLAELLPALSQVWQERLCVLAHPLRSAEANLHEALTSEGLLSDSVRAGFAALLDRRAQWRQRTTGEAAGTAALHVGKGPSGLWSAALSLAEQAARPTTGHAERKQSARASARAKELAWLLARLCELLLRAEAPQLPSPGIDGPG